MVKVLSRDAVQRMTGRRSSTTSNVSGGGGDSGVSQAWVEENYISKDFFSQLFTIHGTRTYIDEDTQEEVTEEVVITPNAIADGEEYKLSNVEVSVGLWTQQFLSALGLNPGGGGGSVTLNNVLDGINNTAFPSATPSSAGQAIVWNGTKWTFGTAGGGGGTVTSITAGTGLTGGTITASGTIALSQETQTAIAAGATAYGWGDHSQAGYLTSSAISDMATKTWVGRQGYLTSSALTGYATQSWVQQQGYLTSHQSVDGTFWGQSWTNHGTVSGNMTNVGNITSNTNGTINYFSAMEMLPKSDAGNGGAIYFHYKGITNYASSYIIENTSGILSVQGHGTTGLVVGDADSDYIQIGNARLVWDSANNALKAIKADGTSLNLYATGGVSALGMSAGTSQLDAMTFNHLSVKNSLTLNGSVSIITGSSSQIVRADGDGDCIYLLNGYTDSYINSQRYYYNQYDNIGLHGTNYNYDDSWFIDPDGCAKFKRLYLDSTRYLYINGGTLYYYNGSQSKTIVLS